MQIVNACVVHAVANVIGGRIVGVDEVVGVVKLVRLVEWYRSGGADATAHTSVVAVAAAIQQRLPKPMIVAIILRRCLVNG